MNEHILSLVIAYLIGSIPFGFILTKMMRGGDIRKSGSGNIGATNVMRHLGKKAGYLTFMLDSSKGIIALLICSNITQYQSFAECYMVGIAAIIGHCFPIWLKFRGGKGVSTALGVVAYSYIAFAPQLWWVLLFFTAIWLSAFQAFKIVSIASIVVFCAITISNFLIFNEILFSIILSGIIIARHHQNISRLINGAENNFTKK